MTENSMTTLEKLIQEFRKLRTEKDGLSQALKDLQAKLDPLEEQIIAYLQEQKLSSVKGEFGQVIVSQRQSFRVPRGDDERAFRDWCMAQGEHIFEAIYKPNSQSLNAFLKAEWEAALDAKNIDYRRPPGIAEAEILNVLSLRKG